MGFGLLPMKKNISGVQEYMKITYLIQLSLLTMSNAQIIKGFPLRLPHPVALPVPSLRY